MRVIGRIGRLSLRGLLAVIALFVVIVLLVLLRWMQLSGPAGGLSAMARLAQHGPTTIDDFRLYPARHLQASGDARPLPPADSAQAPTTVPTDDGQRPSPEEFSNDTDTLALLLIRGPALQVEHYGRGHGADEPSQLFSVSKSITSMLVGIAIGEGRLRSEDVAVTERVPELAGSGFGSVSLRHLLTMSSGMNYVENDNPFGRHIALNYTSALERMILGLRADTGQTGAFRYKSGDTALLSLALARALAPMTITGYAQLRLWSPLGMEHDAVWSLDREGGLEKAWCCLATTARDLARIGMLMRDGGRWRGEQLLDPGWIGKSIRPAFDADAWDAELRAAGLDNYGYGWWLGAPDQGDYLALGKDGQYLYVNPARDVVIVRLGRSQGGMGSGRWLALFRRMAQEAIPPGLSDPPHPPVR